jgi:flagellin
MADVVLNSAVRSNLRTLQSTTELLNQTEERLATGKKVNSALDNPASFFTANALDRRSSDLSSLLDSVASSIKTLEAADNGIKAITEIVEGLKATARAALQSPIAVDQKAAVTSGDLGVGASSTNLMGGATESAETSGQVSFTFGAATTLTDAADSFSFNIAVDGGASTPITINRAAVQAAGNGDNTIDSPSELRQILGNLLGPNVSVGGAGNAVTIASNTTGTTSSVAITGFTETDANNNTTDGTGLGNQSGAGMAAVSTPSVLDGKSLVVKNKDGNNVSVTFGTGPNQVDSIEELNKFFEDNDVQLDATFDINSRSLKISADNAIANSTPLDIGGSVVGAGKPFTNSAFSDPVLDDDAALKRANFADDFNDAMKEIDNLAKDANYNGVNLLMGDDLDVIFNEDGSSKLEVKGVTFDADGVGLSSITAEQFYDSGSIQNVLDQIDSAFQTIEAQSSKFGSQLQIVQTREVFTKDMIGTLDDGAHALTAADTNEEAANLATLQTRQQLIVSSLSISTQQESAVLQLLR